MLNCLYDITDVDIDDINDDRRYDVEWCSWCTRDDPWEYGECNVDEDFEWGIPQPIVGYQSVTDSGEDSYTGKPFDIIITTYTLACGHTVMTTTEYPPLRY